MPKGFFLLKITFLIFLFCHCEQDKKPINLNLPDSNYKNTTTQKALPKFENTTDENATTDEKKGAILERMASKRIIFTKHALCRMECRYIDEMEIKFALKEGRINEKKSQRNDKPCPTFAIETRSQDGQLVRVVCADCQEYTKIITVIDLENKFKCNCY